MSNRVLASATAEVIGGEGSNYTTFRVIVSGSGQHEGIHRTYEIDDQNIDSAAWEGIRRFVAEHEAKA